MQSFLRVNINIHILWDMDVLGQLNKSHDVLLLNMRHMGIVQY